MKVSLVSNSRKLILVFKKYEPFTQVSNFLNVSHTFWKTFSFSRNNGRTFYECFATLSPTFYDDQQSDKFEKGEDGFLSRNSISRKIRNQWFLPGAMPPLSSLLWTKNWGSSTGLGKCNFLDKLDGSQVDDVQET